VHNVAARPRAASVGGRRVPFTWNAGRRLLDIVVPLQPRQSAAVTIVL
jgi:hypothetical protein